MRSDDPADTTNTSLSGNQPSRGSDPVMRVEGSSHYLAVVHDMHAKGRESEPIGPQRARSTSVTNVRLAVAALPVIFQHPVEGSSRTITWKPVSP